MSEWWSALPVLAQVFYLFAIPSTIILLIQTILLFLGGGGDALDSDTSGLGDGASFGEDADTGGGDYDFDAAGLRIFSIRGIMAFITVGSWVGIITLEAGGSGWMAVLMAAVFGFAALLGIAKLMQIMMKLQESGNVDLKKALGKSGEVYLTIPAEGKSAGKINIILSGALGEYSAICYEKEPIKTGSRVRVVDIVADLFVVESEN